MIFRKHEKVKTWKIDPTMANDLFNFHVSFFPLFTLSISLAPSDHLFCHFLCLLFLILIVTFTFFYLLKAFKLEQLLDTCTMNKNRAVFKQSKIHIHIIKLYGRAVFCAFNSCWRRFLLY